MSSHSRSPQTQRAHDYLLTLGRLTVDFGAVERAPRYPSGRHETDVEHSFHLAVSAIELATDLYPDLDVGLVAQFSLVHDMPEVYAGDTRTFKASEETLRLKKEAEAKATARLLKELPPHTAQLLERYEEQIEPEARFVRLVDKLLPAIINIMADDVNTFKEDYGVADIQELHDLRAGYMQKFRGMFPEFDALHLVVERIWESQATHLFK